MEQADPGDGTRRAPTWRRSSRCDSATCVEVAIGADQVAVRDSKQEDGPILGFPAPAWSSFVAGLRAGDFDPR